MTDALTGTRPPSVAPRLFPVYLWSMCREHVITITGDAGVNDCVVNVTQDKMVQVDVNTIHREWKLSNVTAINASLGGNFDWFVYSNGLSDETTDYPPVDDSHLTVTVNLGNGHDAATVLGSAGARFVINGNAGDDCVDCLGAGGCTVQGGAGDDVIEGSDGDDLIYGGPGDDQIDVYDGRDTVDGGTGSDVIWARDYLGESDLIYYDATDAIVWADPDDTLVLV